MVITVKPPKKAVFRKGTVVDAQSILRLEKYATGANRGTVENLVAFLASPSGNAGLCHWNAVTKPLVGYFLYDAYPETNSLVLRDLLVHPHYRRQGIALSFLASLSLFCENYHQQGIARVHERNLTAQLLLRKAGWRCQVILPNLFGKAEHAYRFAFPIS